MKKILIATLITAASSIVIADEHSAAPGYSYVRAAVSASDWDWTDGSASTVSVHGSVEVSDHIFVSAGYADGEHADMNVEFSASSFGVGYFSEMSSDTSMYTSLNYERATVDPRYVDQRYWDNETYHYLVWDAGARKNISEHVELNSSFYALYSDERGTATGVSAGAIYNVNSNFGLELGLSFAPRYSSSISAGIRYNF